MSSRYRKMSTKQLFLVYILPKTFPKVYGLTRIKSTSVGKALK